MPGRNAKPARLARGIPQQPALDRGVDGRYLTKSDRRRVKAMRTYTIEEVAGSPILILGSDLAECCGGARRAAGRPCGADVLPEVPQAPGAGRPDGRLRRRVPFAAAHLMSSTDPAAAPTRGTVGFRQRREAPAETGAPTI
jgi:hypothetical protein